MTAEYVDDIEFSDPPVVRNGWPRPTEYTFRFARACRKRPGRWALFGRYDKHSAAVDARNRIVKAGGPAYGDAVWEATTRKESPHSWGVWARFIAEKDEPSSAKRSPRR